MKESKNEKRSIRGVNLLSWHNERVYVYEAPYQTQQKQEEKMLLDEWWSPRPSEHAAAPTRGNSAEQYHSLCLPLPRFGDSSTWPTEYEQ
jgi:hypothetical protein